MLTCKNYDFLIIDRIFVSFYKYEPDIDLESRICKIVKIFITIFNRAFI